MTGLALLLAASAMGVDYGWRPHEEGGVEYIIQIEPEVFASLQAGGDIISEIHPDAGDVRRFRIRVGRGALPREEAKAAPADDGPLPPAPPGDQTSESDPTAKTESLASGRSSPPLNHLAQGSGYGGPFGGYSGGYTRSTTSGSPATAASGTSGASNSGNYSGAGTTGGAYAGSSRGGYSEYTGSTTGTSLAPANSSASNAPTASTAATGDEAWNRGEVRTASNQQTVTATSSNANTGGAAAAPATSAGQSTSAQPPASQPGTGVSAANTTLTQPAYNANTTGSYRGTRDYSTTGTTDSTGYPQGQTGSVTPLSSGYENSRTAAASNQPQAAQGDQSRWTAASAARQPDPGIAPPPAYPQGNAGEQPSLNAAPAANGGYSSAANNGTYGNQYPPGAAPPLLAPPAAAQGNYGYVPAGYPPYQVAAQPGAGYGQAPGYYAMPSMTPPVLTAAANTSTSSSTRSRQDEEEEEDYRDRRSATVVAAAPAAAPAQTNIANSEPWLAFTITIVLLFASIGGNIYLLWISQDFYWRYKELANDLRTVNSAAS